MAQKLYDNMYQTNPQFRQFADSVQGKSPQQVCQEYGKDFGEAQQAYNQMSSKWRG